MRAVNWWDGRSGQGRANAQAGDAYRLQGLDCIRALLRDHPKEEYGEVVHRRDERARRERECLREVQNVQGCVTANRWVLDMAYRPGEDQLGGIQCLHKVGHCVLVLLAS